MEPLLDPPGVSALLGVPVETLKRWRYERTGPDWLYVGRLVRYRPAVVDAWVKERERQAKAANQ